MKYNDTLLPTIIDERAKSDPNRLYCIQIQSEDVENSLLEITYGEWANAINRCAWWMEENFGRRDGFPTIAYLGPYDVRYALVTLGAVKASYKALLLSSSNSAAGQLNLLQKTDCSIYLLADGFQPEPDISSEVLSRSDIRVHGLPDLEHWLNPEKVPEHQFTSTLSTDPERPFVVLHTSGSTGLPKPIQYRMASLAVFGQFMTPDEVIPNSPPNTPHIWKDIECQYMTFTTSHTVGLLFLTAQTVYWDLVTMVGPVSPPSTELLERIINLGRCQAVTIPPSILETMAKDPVKLECLRQLKHVNYTGSQLSSPSIADKLRSQVKLFTTYGTTEISTMPMVLLAQEDYEWVSFSDLCGVEFQHHSDDRYELVVVKNPKLSTTQFVFQNFPDLDEWRTKDLFSPHPTRKGLWKYCGRSDDMLILNRGRNINPLWQEGTLSKHPEVVSGLLTGSGKPSLAWLIEARHPPETDKESEALLKELWPTIEECNRRSEVLARVTKDRVIFTSPTKPMRRSDKGNVQRQATLAAYQDELDGLYL